MSQVKLDQIIEPGKASPETKVVDGATISPETTGALIAINTEDLNQESLAILNQLIAESDVEKTKDLTYLFNQNQNKKTMVRMDNLSKLQDLLVNEYSRRVAEKPDEISNQEIITSLKTIQDILERGQKNIVAEPEKPLIQINTQTNNIGDGAAGLTRDSRKRVEDAVASLINGLAAEQAKTVDAKLVEDEEDD